MQVSQRGGGIRGGGEKWDGVGRGGARGGGWFWSRHGCLVAPSLHDISASGLRTCQTRSSVQISHPNCYQQITKICSSNEASQ